MTQSNPENRWGGMEATAMAIGAGAGMTGFALTIDGPSKDYLQRVDKIEDDNAVLEEAEGVVAQSQPRDLKKLKAITGPVAAKNTRKITEIKSNTPFYYENELVVGGEMVGMTAVAALTLALAARKLRMAFRSLRK